MKVIVFDGDCALCNRMARFVVKWNRNPELKITDFDSTWTKANVPELIGRKSVIFFDRDYYKHSTAVIRALDAMHHRMIPFKLLLWIPDVIRDDVYKWVARNRDRFGGGADGSRVAENCPMPSKKFKKMYLE